MNLKFFSYTGPLTVWIQEIDGATKHIVQIDSATCKQVMIINFRMCYTVFRIYNVIQKAEDKRKKSVHLLRVKRLKLICQMPILNHQCCGLGKLHFEF